MAGARKARKRRDWINKLGLGSWEFRGEEAGGGGLEEEWPSPRKVRRQSAGQPGPGDNSSCLGLSYTPLLEHQLEFRISLSTSFLPLPQSYEFDHLLIVIMAPGGSTRSQVTPYLIYLVFIATLGPLQFGYHLVRMA